MLSAELRNAISLKLETGAELSPSVRPRTAPVFSSLKHRRQKAEKKKKVNFIEKNKVTEKFHPLNEKRLKYLKKVEEAKGAKMRESLELCSSKKY
jgi:hypothetical protein